MANINDVYPSKFLKVHDLQGKTPTVTIERVGVEQVRNRVKADTRAVLYFKGKAKGLLCNKTNAQTVASIARSPETNDWIGQAVTLYATTATFGTDTHDVIRIKAPVPVQRKDVPVPVQRKDVNDSLSSRPRPPLPAIFTDELEIDLQDAGVRR